MTDRGMLIIGGGVAGASAAAELRHQGYEGPVRLATRELLAPYHRPPSSKSLLIQEEDVSVLPDNWWSENDVELLTRSAVMQLDTAAHVARLANKGELEYDKALLATGAMVRRLAVEDGAGLQGIHYLRAPMNAGNLRNELAGPQRVVLVGGSFIAVEVAAQLTELGHECTMVMLESRCLEKTLGPTMSKFVDGLLRAHGVSMVTAAQVAAFEGEERVTGVRTSDGRVIPADVVVVGVGAVPDVKLARSAGLEIGESGGIVCDEGLAASGAESVFVAGDSCEYDSVLHRRRVRIEHERHAQAQGRTAARNMLGENIPHMEVPYFWTDIASWATLEYRGLAGDVEREVVTGSVENGNFTVWQLADGHLIGAVTSARPQDVDRAESIILGNEDLPEDLVAGIVSQP